MTEIYRTHGISQATFYKWRSKYGGMDASMLKQVKEFAPIFLGKTTVDSATLTTITSTMKIHQLSELLNLHQTRHTHLDAAPWFAVWTNHPPSNPGSLQARSRQHHPTAKRPPVGWVQRNKSIVAKIEKEDNQRCP